MTSYVLQFKTWQELYEFMKPFEEIAAYQAKQQDIKNALEARLEGVSNIKMTHGDYRHLEHEYSQLVVYFDPNPDNLNEKERAIYFKYWTTCGRCHRMWNTEAQAEDCEYERIEQLITQS